MPRRIGILGGMFNPVHDGHLRAAIEARELLRLDEVRLLPCAEPPHRQAPAVPARVRAEMVALAVRDVAGLVADPRELELPGPSYTVRTLEHFRREFPDDVLVLLLGEDAFSGLDSWYEWKRIPTFAHVAVMRRPGSASAMRPPELQPWLAQAECGFEALAASDRKSGGLAFCDITALDISSTRIRELIRAGRDPRFLLPDAVLDVITREGLYKD